MEILQPLDELEWIPRPKVLALRRLGLETAENLLTHYPRRYEDRHQFPEFPREESDTPICLCGEVTKTRILRFGGWKKIFEATLQEPNAHALSQALTLRWFNLHYVQKMIATGQQLVVFGKPKLRSIIHRLLVDLSDESLEIFAPASLVHGDRRQAIHAIHFPESWAARDQAREYLVLSEFFAMQLLIASRRAESSARMGESHCGRGKLLDKFLAGLPFELTATQHKVIEEIRRDLASSHPMNRLLQGDVGSGKTVVAIAAILLAVEAGFQTALMAPTQILAEQHYAFLGRWLEPLGVRMSIRTAARQEESGPLPLFGDGESLGNARVSRATQAQGDAPNIIIGTHALLYDTVSFSNLGLVVIDEQHKFGVAQRARLTAREPAPDVLVMA